MLNKNDPLIGAVQEVMKRNQLERDAAKLVNEKFGVSDRKALPHEKQGAWDAAYKEVLSEGLHPNQQKLDVHEPEKDKLTKHDFKMLRAKKKTMEEDVTSPSAMGIKKPDYATDTPDYAKSKEQTVNRAAKTSLPAGTVKEAKVNPYAVGMAAVKKSTGDQPPMEKKNIMKAHKIAKKIIAKKKINEGFNNRHDLSVTASDENQVVAEQLNLDLKTSGLAGQRSVVSRSGNRMNMSNAAAERLRSNMIKDTSYTGMKNNIRTRADYVRQGLSAGTGQKPARFNDQGVRRPVAPAARPTAAQTRPTGKAPASVNAATGSLTATDTQRRAGMSVTNVRDVAYGANPTAKKLGPASSTGGQGPSPVPTSAAVQPKISAAGMAANRQRLANAAQANRVGSGPMAPAPGSAQAATVAKAPPAAPAPSTATTKTAPPTPKVKPTAPKVKTAPAAPSPVRKAAPQPSSTPAQRAQANRRIERGNAAPGVKLQGLGVKTGTKVVQKPMAINKRLPGK